uniref:Unkown protein n=1 Tax=Riptortus pedestris TaxID=329032 RepID=R4WQZ3_RIPPE|nr:unkown protein [Riptortus pedestris]
MEVVAMVTVAAGKEDMVVVDMEEAGTRAGTIMAGGEAAADGAVDGTHGRAAAAGAVVTVAAGASPHTAVVTAADTLLAGSHTAVAGAVAMEEATEVGMATEVVGEAADGGNHSLRQQSKVTKTQNRSHCIFLNHIFL